MTEELAHGRPRTRLGNGRFGELAVVVATTIIAVAISQWVPFVVMVENWLSDYRIATLTPNQPQSSDIVIVTITEDTVQLFPYRYPVDRHFIAGVLRTLDKAGARAIGVDVLFDQATESDKDDELKATIRSLRAPLIIGYVDALEGEGDEQQSFLDDFVPPEHRGFATLSKDPWDSTVRRMYPGRRDTEGQFISGFPLRIAESVRPGQTFTAQTIAWRGSPGNGGPPFRKFPAHTLAVLPADWFKDKIVLFGADLTITDRHRTPLATVPAGATLMAGIEIHAHAIDQLLSQRRARTLSLPAKVAFAATVAVVGVLLANLSLTLLANLTLAAGLVAAIWITGFVLFRNTAIMLPLVLPTVALCGAWWASGVQGSMRERKQKQFLKEAFSLYMSPELVNQLVADPSKMALGGERRDMSFLFTDVTGFTTVSENIEPGLLGNLLNSYFNGLCRIIIAEGGSVIDFIGDAVFAIFGAPLAQADHAARAIRCAAKIEAFSAEFSQLEEVKVWHWGETRVGVHSGVALVGNFGSDLKFKYAPIGDAVNTASRVEGLNKFFGTTTCLSAPAVQAAGDRMVRPLGRFVLKGKSEALGVYQPVSAEWQRSADGQLYTTAYALMAAGRSRDALDAFEDLLTRQAGDRAVFIHAERLRRGEPDDVIVMQEK